MAKKTVKNAEGFTLPAKGKGKYKVHVVSGTHWDREWRFTAEQSKLRLAELVDGVIEKLEQDPGFRHYMLDGGAVVLEDYMSVRPEMFERLKALVSSGRTPTVAWYTLPETNLVMPEAMIRNLLIGRRIAKPFGGTMRAGYTATGYGQPAQLPQIYKGFDIDSATFYRGTTRYQQPPVCWWQSPDGSKVLLVRGHDEVTRTNWWYFAYMPIVLGTGSDPVEAMNGYEYTTADQPVHMADNKLCQMGFKAMTPQAAIPRSSKAIMKGYQVFRDQAYKYAVGQHVIGYDMEDNSTPWSEQPKLIERLNGLLDDTEIVQSTMDECVDAIAKEVEGCDIHVQQGELRNTLVEFGWNGLFGMSQSSRVDLKMLNEKSETEMVLLAEPLASFAEAVGSKYPRTSLDAAWLDLLKNHSHDSICGAAVDDAHKDMCYRFRQVQTVAEEVSRRACEGIWGRIDHSHCQENDQTLTVFNTLPYRRSGVQQFVLDLPCNMFDQDFTRLPTGVATPYLFDILNEKGKPIPFTVTDFQETKIAFEHEMRSPGSAIKVKRHRILMTADLPAMGYRSFIIRRHSPRYIQIPKPGQVRGHIAQPGGVLENDFLKVEINSNGTFSLTDKKNKHAYENLHYFDDRLSSGDAHHDRPIYQDEVFTTLGLNATIVMAESNPMRGIYRIELKMPVSTEAVDGWYRSRQQVEIPITVWLTLEKGGRRVDIRTKVDNRAKDHRLFAMFPTNIKTDTVSVETSYAVEERSFLWKQTADNAEGHYPYQPMQNFLDLSDGKTGMAVINKGLREYTVWDDPKRTVALTLLRTYGEYYVTTNSNLTPDEKELYPGKHLPGELEFNYAIYPHAGNWAEGSVMTETYDFKTPVRAIQGPAKKGELPSTQSFFKIAPEGKVMLSALCQSEDGKAIILRIWNTTDEPIEAKIRTTLPFKSASKVNMGEIEVVDQLKLSGGAVTVPMRKAEITTIKFWFNSNKVGRNC